MSAAIGGNEKLIMLLATQCALDVNQEDEVFLFLTVAVSIGSLDVAAFLLANNVYNC
jgi:hypothetical protein